MGRAPRIFVEGVSLHIIQRGNNRGAIFQREVDYQVLLTVLQRAASRHGVAIHGYVLMTTHFHLIATPKSDKATAKMMKDADGFYTRYFNREYGRIGTLWNGRYRGIPIESERYWLTCLRYIEQNPCRAGMVRCAEDYRWSSYAAHASGCGPDWLTPHQLYLSLGKTPGARQLAYRALFAQPIPDSDVIIIRQR